MVEREVPPADGNVAATADDGPLSAAVAWSAVARSVLRSASLLARGRVRLPRRNVGRLLWFADGTAARVYRETVLDTRPSRPCTLVVQFRLRGVSGVGHRLFRWESLLNTPLFVGFPGFVSKLWVAHDGCGRYRGLYEWDGPERAADYARSLWRVLALVSAAGSIRYVVVPGLRRDELVAALGPAPDGRPWWRVVEA